MRRLATCLAALAFFGTAAGAAELTEQQRRGQQIYLTGESPSGGAIEAVLGGGQTVMPGGLFPCARCHGETGGGQEEGGVLAPDIRWHTLTKPYALQRADRRARPPYDRDTLVVRAFSLGLDAGGGELNQVMPRYRMSRADAQSLLAYLRVLGSAGTPGVTDDTLTITVLVTPPGDGALGRDWLPGLLSNFVEQVNREGGVYGRRISLVVGSTTVTGADLAGFLQEHQPLALLLPFASGSQPEVARIASEFGLPVVASFPPHSLEIAAGPVFYALPDLDLHARVLATMAASLPAPNDSAISILFDASSATAARAARGVLERRGIAARLVELLPAQELQSIPTGLEGDRLILLASRPLARPFVAALAQRDEPLVVLAPDTDASVLANVKLPPGSRLFLARSSSPGDIAERRLAQLKSLGDGLSMESARLEDVQAVLGAVEILIEALRRSGRGVTRSGLTEALEGLYRFPTGYLRPVSFGPNRRIGTSGAYVVEREPRTGRVMGSWWIGID